MTFDEALEILEMSPRESPEAARRAYLLQLQRNGPEVPPELYARFTAAYDVLKQPEVWDGQAPEYDDDLEDLKREAAARRARRGGEPSSSGPRIIDPSRVPQRGASKKEAPIIDPARVPQRSSGASAEDQKPAIRRSLSDRQSAPRTREPDEDRLAHLDVAPPSTARPAAPAPPAPGSTASGMADPFAELLSESEPDPFVPASHSPGTSNAAEESGPQNPPEAAAPVASGDDPFADLLGSSVSASAPEPMNPVEAALDPEPVTPDPPAPDGVAPTHPSPDPLSADPLLARPIIPKARPAPAESPKPSQPMRGGRARVKPKALDDTSLAILSKLARTYVGVIDFNAVVSSLEDKPDDALGLLAQQLLGDGERVAATGVLVSGFDCMEGKPTRRWIDVRTCIEVVLKLAEEASVDHTAHECSQSVRRALNRWRAETEDPRIVFQEATIQRWSWLNEITQLPQSFPHELRLELVHAVRSGDLEEAILPFSTFASRNPEEMATIQPVLAQTAPKVWGAIEPLLKKVAKKPKKADEPDEKGSDTTKKKGSRRRKRGQQRGSSRGLPAWAWGLILVCIVGGVFSLVASQAVQDETEDDDVTVAADVLCKVLGGNKPACHEARRVVRALRSDDCATLEGGLIQDFSDKVDEARQLRGALDTGANDSDNLQKHRDTLVEKFYAVCPESE